VKRRTALISAVFGGGAAKEEEKGEKRKARSSVHHFRLSLFIGGGIRAHLFVGILVREEAEKFSEEKRKKEEKGGPVSRSDPHFTAV